MTPDELRALADAATPGPWKWRWLGEDEDPGWTDHGPWLETVAGQEKGPKRDRYWSPDAQILSSWGHDAWGLGVDDADARLIALSPDLARLCVEQHEMLGKAADTLADLAVSLRLLRHTTLATAVDIAETHTRAALAKMGELEARCDLDH